MVSLRRTLSFALAAFAALASSSASAGDMSRPVVVERLLALLAEAARRGCELVVYPELALTTFFPRWNLEEGAELDGFYETEMPSVATKPLFDEAARLGIGVHLGFAELTPEGHRYNSALLVELHREGVVRVARGRRAPSFTGR